MPSSRSPGGASHQRDTGQAHTATVDSHVAYMQQSFSQLHYNMYQQQQDMEHLKAEDEERRQSPPQQQQLNRMQSALFSAADDDDLDFAFGDAVKEETPRHHQPSYQRNKASPSVASSSRGSSKRSHSSPLAASGGDYSPFLGRRENSLDYADDDDVVGGSGTQPAPSPQARPQQGVGDSSGQYPAQLEAGGGFRSRRHAKPSGGGGGGIRAIVATKSPSPIPHIEEVADVDEGSIDEETREEFEGLRGQLEAAQREVAMERELARMRGQIATLQQALVQEKHARAEERQAPSSEERSAQRRGRYDAGDVSDDSDDFDVHGRAVPSPSRSRVAQSSKAPTTNSNVNGRPQQGNNSSLGGNSSNSGKFSKRAAAGAGAGAGGASADEKQRPRRQSLIPREYEDAPLPVVRKENTLEALLANTEQSLAQSPVRQSTGAKREEVTARRGNATTIHSLGADEHKKGMVLLKQVMARASRYEVEIAQRKKERKMMEVQKKARAPLPLQRKTAPQLSRQKPEQLPPAVRPLPAKRSVSVEPLSSGSSAAHRGGGGGGIVRRGGAPPQAAGGAGSNVSRSGGLATSSSLGGSRSAGAYRKLPAAKVKEEQDTKKKVHFAGDPTALMIREFLPKALKFEHAKQHAALIAAFCRQQISLRIADARKPYVHIVEKALPVLQSHLKKLLVGRKRREESSVVLCQLLLRARGSQWIAQRLADAHFFNQLLLFKSFLRGHTSTVLVRSLMYRSARIKTFFTAALAVSAAIRSRRSLRQRSRGPAAHFCDPLVALAEQKTLLKKCRAKLYSCGLICERCVFRHSPKALNHREYLASSAARPHILLLQDFFRARYALRHRAKLSPPRGTLPTRANPWPCAMCSRCWLVAEVARRRILYIALGAEGPDANGTAALLAGRAIRDYPSHVETHFNICHEGRGSSRRAVPRLNCRGALRDFARHWESAVLASSLMSVPLVGRFSGEARIMRRRLGPAEAARFVYDRFCWQRYWRKIAAERVKRLAATDHCGRCRLINDAWRLPHYETRDGTAVPCLHWRLLNLPNLLSALHPTPQCADAAHAVWFRAARSFMLARWGVQRWRYFAYRRYLARKGAVGPRRVYGAAGRGIIMVPPADPLGDEFILSAAAGAADGRGRMVGGGDAGAARRQSTRARLLAFYSVYNPDPEKMRNVAAVLQQFAGQEAKLIAKMCQKYGPEPPFVPCRAELVELLLKHDPAQAANVEPLLVQFSGREEELLARMRVRYEGSEEVQEHRRNLIAFYEKHNPAKLGTVDKLLLQYHGREAQLLHDLCVKYGEIDVDGEPGSFITDAAAKRKAEEERAAAEEEQRRRDEEAATAAAAAAAAAEEEARVAAEERALAEADRKAKEQVDRKAKQWAERKAKEDAERQDKQQKEEERRAAVKAMQEEERKKARAYAKAKRDEEAARAAEAKRQRQEEAAAAQLEQDELDAAAEEEQRRLDELERFEEEAEAEAERKRIEEEEAEAEAEEDAVMLHKVELPTDGSKEEEEEEEEEALLKQREKERDALDDIESQAVQSSHGGGGENTPPIDSESEAEAEEQSDVPAGEDAASIGEGLPPAEDDEPTRQPDDEGAEEPPPDEDEEPERPSGPPEGDEEAAAVGDDEEPPMNEEDKDEEPEEEEGLPPPEEEEPPVVVPPPPEEEEMEPVIEVEGKPKFLIKWPNLDTTYVCEECKTPAECLAQQLFTSGKYGSDAELRSHQAALGSFLGRMKCAGECKSECARATISNRTCIRAALYIQARRRWNNFMAKAREMAAKKKRHGRTTRGGASCARCAPFLELLSELVDSYPGKEAEALANQRSKVSKGAAAAPREGRAGEREQVKVRRKTSKSRERAAKFKVEYVEDKLLPLTFYMCERCIHIAKSKIKNGLSAREVANPAGTNVADL